MFLPFIYRSQTIMQPKFCPPPSMKIDVSQSGEMRSCYYCHLCGTEYTVKYNLVRHLDRHPQSERDAMPRSDPLSATAEQYKTTARLSPSVYDCYTSVSVCLRLLHICPRVCMTATRRSPSVYDCYPPVPICV